MSARDEILAAVRAARPPHVDLPDSSGFVGRRIDRPDDRVANPDDDAGPPGEVAEAFVAALKAAGGGVVRVESEAGLDRQIRDLVGSKGHVVAPVEAGAVWLAEADLGARVLPVIVPRLVVVLDAKAIVPTMHDAYAAVEGEASGFGQFVGGPSKTADIEQSLVIGAHGANETTVVLVGG